jgi:3'(2'), 5'-bisphosphate nucleotidase
MVTTTDLRSAVADLARDAGRAAMRYYNDEAPSEVRQKDDRSPVTLADEVAHQILLEGLQRLDPSTPVISEEADAAGFDSRRSWRRFWLVDPLDGTKEFIKRRAEFTVNVALIEDGEPVLGVVLAPALDLLYWGVKGEGSWREEQGGAPERIYSTEPEPGSPKFCWVAEGKADIYPRLGPTMEWDVAAGDCVYRQSGRNGERRSPLTYNKPDLRNPSFVIGI